MESSLCLDPVFPRVLLRQKATSILDLPQEILEKIVVPTVTGTQIQIFHGLRYAFSSTSTAEFLSTRQFAILFFVNRRFYHAACTSLIQNLRLHVASQPGDLIWLERLAQCPEGCIRSMEISHAACERLASALTDPGSSGFWTMTTTLLAKSLSRLDTIRVRFYL